MPCIELLSLTKVYGHRSIALLEYAIPSERDEDKQSCSRKNRENEDEFFHKSDYYLAITSNERDFLVFRIFASIVSISSVCVPMSMSLLSLMATV